MPVAVETIGPAPIDPAPGDHATNEWTVDWSRRPRATVFDQAFEAIRRRSASFDYVLARSRGAARAELFPGAHPFDVLRIPTLHGVGWFDNITRPTCSTTRR